MTKTIKFGIANFDYWDLLVIWCFISHAYKRRPIPQLHGMGLIHSPSKKFPSSGGSLCDVLSFASWWNLFSAIPFHPKL